MFRAFSPSLPFIIYLNMLLAQSFDPLKEQQLLLQQQQQQQRQQKKLPLFCLISRARRALSEFKNKMHENIANRHIQALQARDHRLMVAGNNPPWYGGGCSYDPYFTTQPHPPLIMLPPPPPLPPHLLLAPPPPYPIIHPHQAPYCICVHLTSPPQANNNSVYFSPSSSITDSTLYSSSISSMHSGNEKELVEEVEYEPHQPTTIHPLQEENNYYLTRRNSDIMHDRQRNNRRRPSLQSRRWNSSHSHSSDYYH